MPYIPVAVVSSGTGSGGQTELDYVQITANVPITATSAGTSDTVITGNPVTYNGSTRICIETYASYVEVGTTAGSYIQVGLWDGGTQIGAIALHGRGASGGNVWQPHLTHTFLTPTAGSHTYALKAYRSVSNGLFGAGTGVGDDYSPAFLRITTA